MYSFRNIRDDGIIKVATAADRLALLPTDGDIVEQVDTHSLYSYDSATDSWILISQPDVGDLVTSVFGRIGDVAAEPGDYISQQITYTPSTPSNWNLPTPTNVYEALEQISYKSNELQTDTAEPNGFINRTDSTMSFNHLTRTFTISPVISSYSIYVTGVKQTITTTKTSTIPNITGNYYFYINGSGTLTYTTIFNANLISSLAYCAFIYWDATGSGSERIVTFGDERHGITMDGQTHAYLHTTHGAAFGNGCGLVGFTIGAGNNNADAQFTASSGLIWDEDIKFDILAQTTFPILYRSNGTWKRKNADVFPFIYNGTAGYVGTRPAYNLNTGGVWSLAEVTNTYYWLVHIFATNDINTPFVGILGQTQYNNGPSAQAGALTEIRTISGLPVTEFCPIGSVIFQSNNSYTNTPKAKVVQTSSNENYVDFRLQSVRPGVLA